MSFQKNKITKYGVNANYHTITDVKMSFISLPSPLFDEDNILTGYLGGSKSTITLSSYKDKDAYDSRCPPLEQKIFDVDFITAITICRSTDKTCEEAAYDLIKSLDSFYSDAEWVDG